MSRRLKRPPVILPYITAARNAFLIHQLPLNRPERKPFVKTLATPETPSVNVQQTRAIKESSSSMRIFLHVKVAAIEATMIVKLELELLLVKCAKKEKKFFPSCLFGFFFQNNNIQMIHDDTFCKGNDLNYIRMALEDIRLDGNPVNLSRTPQAYVCLPRIPVGALI